ncbi:hypothetical protein NDN08_000376 [Rhodosorus marinus]|uniref:Chloride channel protein n=1 Tax=Rhodosorus marinus TaxID=101924 RepID=A0AAV8UMW4_9RHOD|nr:hypothetical protein NDN08_000376 [Rhodosorus marinus]
MDLAANMKQSRTQSLKKSSSLDEDGLGQPVSGGSGDRTRALVGILDESSRIGGRQHRRRVSEDSRGGSRAPSSVTNFEDVIFVDMFDSSHLVSSPAEQNDLSRLSSKASSMFNIAFESGSNQQRLKRRERRLSMEVETRKSGSTNSFRRLLSRFDRPPTLKSRAWEWKRPIDEDSIQPVGALLYLAIIGWLTFAICFSVSFVTDALDTRIKELEFQSVVVLRSIAAVGAFLIPSYFSEYAIGSGIPELKCILSGSFLPHSLSPSTIGTRVAGLTLALVSGLSVGRLGPFMHIAAGIASTIARLNIFPSLSSSAKYQVQAISAATAAGVGATLGSPVGGTLMSIELMSSYYFVHWLPMALYCSVMGYILAVSVIRMDEKPFFNTNVHAELHDSAFSRLISYVVLGCVCGVVGHLLVKFTSSSIAFRSKYLPTKKRSLCVALVLCFTIVHNLICHNLGGLLWASQRKGVRTVFTAGLDNLPVWKALQDTGLTRGQQSIVTLGIFVVTKFILTGLTLALPVPAGTFGPIFEVGALLGAFVGALAKLLPLLSVFDTRVYAIAGAAALPTGVMHTISIAVVMLELVGDSVNILPVALACLSSYFTSKLLTADLFSVIIKRRLLPLVIGLRESHEVEREKWRSEIAGTAAKEIMVTDYPYVTRRSSRATVQALLTRTGWTVCAFLSDEESRFLLGVISRSAIEDSLRSRTEKYGGLVTSGVKFLEEYDQKTGHAFVDPAPLQLPSNTPYWKVATYFQMLGVAFVFVVQDGHCEGMITKGTLISYNHRFHDINEAPIADDHPAEDVILGEAIDKYFQDSSPRYRKTPDQHPCEPTETSQLIPT